MFKARVGRCHRGQPEYIIHFWSSSSNIDLQDLTGEIKPEGQSVLVFVSLLSSGGFSQAMWKDLSMPCFAWSSSSDALKTSYVGWLCAVRDLLGPTREMVVGATFSFTSC